MYHSLCHCRLRPRCRPCLQRCDISSLISAVDDVHFQGIKENSSTAIDGVPVNGIQKETAGRTLPFSSWFWILSFRNINFLFFILFCGCFRFRQNSNSDIKPDMTLWLGDEERKAWHCCLNIQMKKGKFFLITANDKNVVDRILTRLKSGNTK